MFSSSPDKASIVLLKLQAFLDTINIELCWEKKIEPKVERLRERSNRFLPE